MLRGHIKFHGKPIYFVTYVKRQKDALQKSFLAPNFVFSTQDTKYLGFPLNEFVSTRNVKRTRGTVQFFWHFETYLKTYAPGSKNATPLIGKFTLAHRSICSGHQKNNLKCQKNPNKKNWCVHLDILCEHAKFHEKTTFFCPCKNDKDVSLKSFLAPIFTHPQKCGFP